MSHIIIITYYSGTQSAYFKNDPQLLEDLIDYHDSIEEVQEVPVTGLIQTNSERTIRDLIRKIGKSATRDLVQRLCEDKS